MDDRLHLSHENMELFIDMWEGFEVLWNPMDPNYKNRIVRDEACASIASNMGLHWTVDQVRRKIDSLKSYYRASKTKSRRFEKEGYTERGCRRKQWAYYNRIRRFLGNFEHGKPAASLSSSPFEANVSDAAGCPVKAEGAVSSMPEDDIAILCSRGLDESASQQARPVLLFRNSLCRSETSQSSLPSNSPSPAAELPSRKHSCTDSSLEQQTTEKKRAKADEKLEKTAVQMVNVVSTSNSSLDNPHTTYGTYVAERLNSLTSRRRVEIAKHRIDSVLHELAMEEMDE